MIVIFIPAAGASSRMRGRDKLLEPVMGQPILRRVAETALAAKLGPVIVGLRPDDHARQKALRNLPVEIVEVPDASEGMSATLRKGAEAARKILLAHEEDDDEYSGMLVMLPDMPGIRSEDLNEIALNFSMSGGDVQRASTEDGTPGHPVLFPNGLLMGFEELQGDKGASTLLQDQTVWNVPLPDNRATCDLDTPEDWATWRKETGTRI